MDTRISFIIPARNEEAYIGKTIEHILQQPPELVKEIIVVDNGSTDNTAHVAGHYPSVKVIFEPVPGTNRARQTGFEHSTGTVIAFIDADNWVAPNWSRIAIAYLARQNVAGVSGSYLYRDQSWVGRIFFTLSYLFVTYPVYFLVHYILKKGSIVLGGNMAAKREALLRVGGLDTRYTFYGDDVSTGRRLRKVGRMLYTTRLIVSASSRRFEKHGLLKTLTGYILNYAWVILFDKPYTKF